MKRTATNRSSGSYLPPFRLVRLVILRLSGPNIHPDAPCQTSRRCSLNARVKYQHEDTDELFFVDKGVQTIKYENRDVPVKAGELHVVPKGGQHKPVAAEECEILIIEPAGTLNTGEAGGGLTAHEEPWI